MPPLSEVPASGKGYTPTPSPLPPVTQRLDHSPGWKGPDPPVSQMEKTRRLSEITRGGRGTQCGPRCPHFQLRYPHLGISICPNEATQGC